MTTRMVIAAVVLIGTIVGIGRATWQRPGPYVATPVVGVTSESYLRQIAVALDDPSCNIEDLDEYADREVGVVRLLVDGSGNVIDATPLEPVTGGLAEAMKKAGMRAKFQPQAPLGSAPQFLTAKLIFYFVRSEGSCHAIPASEMERRLPR